MASPARLRYSFAAAAGLLAAFVALAAASDTSSDGSSGSSGSDSPSLSSMDVYDVLGLVFMACGLALSSAGGVGGGVIMVPAMVLIMGFDIKVATPISNMGILGGALANAWFNLRKRHPYVDRPLIDADLSLVMIPAVIGGAVIGAVLANLLPSYLLSLLFVVVLIAGNSRMLVKGLALHKKEKAARHQAALEREVLTDGDDGVQSPSAEGETDVYTAIVSSPSMQLPTADLVKEGSAPQRSCICQPLRPEVVTGVDSVSGDKLSAIIESERAFPWNKHLAVLACYMVIVAASIADALVRCGGVAYWALLIAEVPCVGVFTIFASRRLLKEYTAKSAVEYPFVDGDVKWTPKIVLLFPVGCVLAGIVAGMFGVGGAVITGPIMMEMGVVPEVLSATSALMVLYSAAAATAKFAVFKMITWDWAGLLAGLAFIVTSASQVFILGYVRRTGRQSLIILCIVTAAMVGTVLMTYQAIKTTIESYNAPFSVDVCD